MTPSFDALAMMDQCIWGGRVKSKDGPLGEHVNQRRGTFRGVALHRRLANARKEKNPRSTAREHSGGASGARSLLRQSCDHQRWGPRLAKGLRPRELVSRYGKMVLRPGEGEA